MKGDSSNAGPMSIFDSILAPPEDRRGKGFFVLRGRRSTMKGVLGSSGRRSKMGAFFLLRSWRSKMGVLPLLEPEIEDGGKGTSVKIDGSSNMEDS